MLRRHRRYAFGASPTGRSPAVRGAMMIGMLVVLGMLIARARDPNLWRWLADEPAAPEPVALGPAATAPPPVPAPAPAVASPSDDDPAERLAAEKEFATVSDRDELGAEEMPAYWRLLNWSRARPFAELAARGRTD